MWRLRLFDFSFCSTKNSKRAEFTSTATWRHAQWMGGVRKMNARHRCKIIKNKTFNVCKTGDRLGASVSTLFKDLLSGVTIYTLHTVVHVQSGLIVPNLLLLSGDVHLTIMRHSASSLTLTCHQDRTIQTWPFNHNVTFAVFPTGGFCWGHVSMVIPRVDYRRDERFIYSSCGRIWLVNKFLQQLCNEWIPVCHHVAYSINICLFGQRPHAYRHWAKSAVNLSSRNWKILTLSN